MENLENEGRVEDVQSENMSCLLGCYLIAIRTCGNFTMLMVNNKGFL